MEPKLRIYLSGASQNSSCRFAPKTAPKRSWNGSAPYSTLLYTWDKISSEPWYTIPPNPTKHHCNARFLDFSEPADQVVRYSLEGAEFALRISGTAAKNFFIFAQAVLHDSKKTHGKTHLIRLLKEQKPLKFFTVDKDRMHDFARAAKAHGLLFCPIRDKMDPDHIEIAILQDDASKANRIIDKLQLAIVDTGTAELIDTVQQERGETAPETERVQTEDGAVDFEVGADEEQFNMGFPQGSENASPSEPFSDSSKSFANSPSPRADQLRAKGERPSVRMELSDITTYLRRKVEPPKDRMPRMPVKIKRKDKVL